MTYTKPEYLWYQNRALTREDGDDIDAILSPNERSHNNNSID